VPRRSNGIDRGGIVNHRTTASALAVCGLLVTADVAAAGPQPGARYAGESADGDRAFITVHRSGKRLQRYVFPSRVRCTDGKERFLGLWEGGERPIRIDAAGAFSHRTRGRMAYPTRRGRVPGRTFTAIHGSFDATGDVVTGTVRSTFTSRRFRCSGDPVPFTAYRAGTPNAPYQDATMATGVYEGAGRGVSLSLRVIAPGRELVSGSVRWRTRCRTGARVTVRETHRGVWLRGDTLVIRWTRRGRDDGLNYRATTLLRVRFSNQGGYVMAGTLRTRARHFRDGRLVDTCRLDRRVSGAFRP
jgi:hypothetical protein